MEYVLGKEWANISIMNSTIFFYEIIVSFSYIPKAQAGTPHKNQTAQGII